MIGTTKKKLYNCKSIKLIIYYDIIIFNFTAFVVKICLLADINVFNSLMCYVI